MAWFLVDDFTLMIFQIALVLCIMLAMVIVVMFGFAPRQIRQLIMIWLKRKVLDISATPDGVLKFVGRTRRPEGQFEAKIDGKTSIKVLPHGSGPLFQPYRLEGTGITTIITDDSLAVAVAPKMLTAMAVVKLDANKIPKAVRDWAKEVKIPIKKIVEEQGRSIEVVEEKALLEEQGDTCVVLDARYLRDFFGEAYSEMQSRNMLEEMYWRGRRDERKPLLRGGGGGIWLLVIIGLVAVAFLVLVMSSGAKIPFISG